MALVRWLKMFVALPLVLVVVFVGRAGAEVRLPSVMGSRMVLQRDMNVPLWGWAESNSAVTVRLGEQTKRTSAGEDGRWMVHLDPMPAGGPHTMVVEDAESRVELEDILFGEVWVCSGQSNMQWMVRNSNDAEAEIAGAAYPRIRLFQVPLVGTQEPQYDCDGEWKACSPETVPDFTAVGYFFGRELHEQLDVPVGLIQTAWGGSACEAWVRRDVLERIDAFDPLMDRWEAEEADFDWDAILDQYQKRLAKWEAAAAKAKAEGKPAPGKPRYPRNRMTGQHRPANLYNGMILPILPYGIRGAIWYQGESNASRAYQYRALFPTMITNWRDDWRQGDFPFYFVQLANFMARKTEPTDSAWAELREAQTMTLALSNTGQAVTIDIGEADDIHPRNKQDVGKRLALIALKQDYGRDVVWSGPQFKSMTVQGDEAVLAFDHIGGGLVAKGGAPLEGFAIAGEDRRFVWADAEIVGDSVVVRSEKVENPVAVRYAWADNPACNLYNAAGLPACPFRTDDWPGVTIDSK